MEHLNCFLFICLLLALQITAADDGIRVGRKLRTGDRMLKTSEEEEAEAPGSSIALENTGHSTNQTFTCSRELKHYLREANVTMLSEFPCEKLEPGLHFDPPPIMPRCQVTHKRKFKVPRDKLITVVVTPSARVCCEVCRGMRECYSWWRRYSDGHCHLNSVFTLGVYSSNAAGGQL